MNESDYIQKELAYVRMRYLQAEIIMQAMITANKECEMQSKSLAYNEGDFMALIEEHGIHHNAFLSEVSL